jgi:GT2 family glycosyltransferase
MVRRSAVRHAGGLDESLFLYAEDVEWSCRLRDLGYRVAYLPGVRVVHLQGRSETQAAGGAVSTRWLTSLIQLYVRLNGTRWRTIVCVSFTVGFLARAVVYLGLAKLLQVHSTQYAARSKALLVYAGAAWKHAVLL